MNIDAGAVFGLIQSELAGRRPLSESMDRIVSLCAESYPHESWNTLRNLPYDDLTELLDWFVALFRNDPPLTKLAGLWFGLKNPIYRGTIVADMYVWGSSRFDPGDDSWAVNADWRPRNQNAHSTILESIYRIAYQPAGLGNDAEYPLCLAYGCLAVREILQSVNPAEILGTSDQLGIEVGFNGGDFLTIGKLTKSGFVCWT
jgi:hypothetical protein